MHLPSAKKKEKDVKTEKSIYFAPLRPVIHMAQYSLPSGNHVTFFELNNG